MDSEIYEHLMDAAAFFGTLALFGALYLAVRIEMYLRHRKRS